MNQKEEFKKWLQLDSGDGKYVMEKLLDFYVKESEKRVFSALY